MEKQSRMYPHTRLQPPNVKTSPKPPLLASDHVDTKVLRSKEPESIRDIMRSWLPKGPYQFLLMLLALVGSIVSLYRGDTQTFLFILGIVAAGCGIPTVSDVVGRLSKHADEKHSDSG